MSEFYCPEEQETAGRNASRRGRHFDKVEPSGDAGMMPYNDYLLTSTVQSLR